MALVGLGTDIAEIERIENALSRSGEAFARRVLADVEMEKFAQLKQKGRYLAKRFAAKEAASKALGTGIAQGVTFHDFVISNDELGKPVLTLHNKAAQLAQQMAITAIHLSISDERHYAVATVIYESK
ncbi:MULTISPECIES: holo-ACP synthase [Vibrio]|uniref:Holo-[acyl-carrier-protein] synthase n=1 Tax=Vibrio proteolyticus NBRC 13287 TaxID=1219065 RepID=U2ZMF9_VIBPR|nr:MULTISPECIES: holo-ACP synthase [Vibrio]NAW56766.1 holo-ACP synthase [Vibrio sp. V36_P2S2PM302]NAX21506.1 holo-ACP synthase [Vibrio sp. V39_P1S14PM300]NAX28183.1 holo-ACP synthase [Vibrio sp. V38_P2S17PM301]NAX28980.1 holo-ACP synthase [Vibrio sp. V37_P2S8PM304]GAD68951.1 holo-[acyl-carrier-protein] synthase [Vibrio proteolyticus NBRC 13287]